jgi:hypothetical protein
MSMQPLFKYERNESERGRCLIATTNILKGQLIFIDRPVVALQSTGNVHDGVIVCSYCMAFCGSPKQALQVASDPSRLVDITTKKSPSSSTSASASPSGINSEGDDDNKHDQHSSEAYDDEQYAMIQCRQHCGHVYCSRECQEDDWEWGGHKELCTGAIGSNEDAVNDDHDDNVNRNDDDGEGQNAAGKHWTKMVSRMHDDCKNCTTCSTLSPPSLLSSSASQPSSVSPLLEFKIHARDTNEIFLLIAQWLVRILKLDLPYPYEGKDGFGRSALSSNVTIDDDIAEQQTYQTHPFIDFLMDPWWDIKRMELLKQDELSNTNSDGSAEADALETDLTRLCEESHGYLQKALASTPTYQESQYSAQWITPIAIGRLIGSIEQNCLGIRRKHALRQSIMENTDLRRDLHGELIQCLEAAGMIGDGVSTHNDEDDNSVDDDGINEGKEAVEGMEHNVENNSFNNDDTNAESKGDDNTEDCNSNDGNEDEEREDVLLGPDEEWDYTYDEIADFLASFPTPLNIGADDSWDDVFRPLDGTAHFPIVSKMNHCCEPNVVMLYKTRGWGKDHPLVAYCVALKDISVGDELTISYITSDDKYHERQMALANYGFVCSCAKCLREKDMLTDGNLCKIVLDGHIVDNDSDGENDTNEENDSLDESEKSYEEHNNNRSGEEKLNQVAERLETFFNESTDAAIPVVFLTPVSDYVKNLVPVLLDDLQRTNNHSKVCDVIRDLLNQSVDAIENRDFSSCRILGYDLELYLYRHLHVQGLWKDPLFARPYWIASLVAAVGFAHECSFLVAMKYLDKATIVGLNRKAIGDFFSYVEYFASQMAAAPCRPAIHGGIADFLELKVIAEKSSTTAFPNSVDFPIIESSFEDPSDGREMFASQIKTQPILLRGAAAKYPAVQNWRSMNYLVKEFGHRWVKVVADDSRKESMTTFRNFISRYLSTSCSKDCWDLDEATQAGTVNMAYLSYDSLLDQIPGLYSAVDRNPLGTQPVDAEIWIGTGGIRTRLCFNDYAFLLVQIAGATYVRLYSPSDASNLYVESKDGESSSRGTLSDVECEMEDYEKHSTAKNCSYMEVLLLPGDCLFIPSLHGHYSRSLSTSIRFSYRL